MTSFLSGFPRVSCLQMLELDQIGDRLIGSDEDGGLSLEQRKRTTLGVELAANPSLIFLDGPSHDTLVELLFFGDFNILSTSCDR